MLKTCENPPLVYPEVSSVRELGGRWWIAHTRSRNEKAFAWDMFHREVGYYLPMARRIFFSGGRRRVSLMPLFPSYVFVNCHDEEQCYTATATHRLCNLINVDNQDGLLDELSSIQQIICGPAQVDPCPYATVGQLVRIARGPFRGVIGRVVRRDNVLRLVVGVSMLNRGAEMEIDADLLEPME